MDWIKEVEFRDLLTGDMQLIYDMCGHDVLLSLMEHMDGVGLYISGKPAIAAKKRYIRKFCDGRNVKALALQLNVSERFVWKVLEEKKKKAAEKAAGTQMKLF